MTVKGTNTTATQAFRASFKILRKARDMSAQAVSDALAERGHIASRAVLSNLENGRHMVSIPLDLAVGIADVLGVTLNELLSEICDHCAGAPPAGFTCNNCGRVGWIEMTS